MRLDRLTRDQKEWVEGVLKTRSPEDEPSRADARILLSIQKTLREAED